jgi:hypothetical protein
MVSTTASVLGLFLLCARELMESLWSYGCVLQAENEEIGKELQRELDATGLFQSLLGPFLFQVSSHLGSGVLLLILEM